MTNNDGTTIIWLPDIVMEMNILCAVSALLGLRIT